MNAPARLKIKFVLQTEHLPNTLDSFPRLGHDLDRWVGIGLAIGIGFGLGFRVTLKT